MEPPPPHPFSEQKKKRIYQPALQTAPTQSQFHARKTPAEEPYLVTTFPQWIFFFIDMIQCRLYFYICSYFIFNFPKETSLAPTFQIWFYIGTTQLRSVKQRVKDLLFSCIQPKCNLLQVMSSPHL